MRNLQRKFYTSCGITATNFFVQIPYTCSLVIRNHNIETETNKNCSSMRSFTTKYYLLFFLIINSALVKSQTPNLEVFCGNNLSCNIGDWYKYQSFYIKTNYDSTFYSKFILTMYDQENKIVLQTDSFEFIDSIGVGDTLFANILLNPIITSFYEDYGVAFQNGLRLKTGNYSIIFKMYDTLYNFSGDSIHVNFSVEDQRTSALIYPFDNIKLFDSTINNTCFRWHTPFVSNKTNFYYDFRIFEMDSGQINNLEYAYLNSDTIYRVITQDTFHYVFNDLRNLLDSNKWYAWSVKTFFDSTLTTCIKTNEGISTPFVFSKSMSKRSGGIDPLCCSNENSGFEDGTMDGWIQNSGKREELAEKFFLRRWINSLLYPYGKFDWSSMNDDGRNHFRITNRPDIDLSGNFGQVPDGGGMHAIQVGSPQNGRDADKLTRTFTVSNCNKLIKLNYAWVLNDGGHRAMNQASIIVRVYKGRSNDLLDNIITPIHKLAGDYDPKLSSPNNEIRSRNWDCVTIDLNKYIDETVTLEIIISDCAFGAHFGYAYIDFCNFDVDPNFTINNGFCNINDEIKANGSTSTNLTAWVWSVQPCDINGNGTGKEVISEWNYGKGAESDFSLNALIRETGVQCGNFRIKLGGGNDCSNWVEEVKIIQIKCPALSLAGADKCCPNGNCNIKIGKPAVSGYNYEWSPTNCLSNPYVANPYFTSMICNPLPSFTTEYHLKVTDQYGCTDYDTVQIFSIAPTLQSIILDSTSSLCDLKIIANALNYSSIEWKWPDPDNSGLLKSIKGRTDIIFPRYASDVTIQLILKNPCGTLTTNIFVAKRRVFGNLGSLELVFPNIIRTNSTIPQNRILTIYDNFKPVGANKSYFEANYAKFEILNRWGGIAKIWEYQNQQFTNGFFTWDGYVGGKLYRSPSGEVFWRLTLRNCDHKGDQVVFRVLDQYICTKRKWTWNGFYYKCLSGYWQWTESQWNSLFINP